MVIEDKDGRLESVVFGDSLRGRTIREGSRHGLSFIPVNDAPIAPGAVLLRVRGGDISGLELLLTRCFGPEGDALPGASVTIEE